MLSTLKLINQGLYFFVELAMFGSYGYAGFKLVQHPYGKYLAAVGLPLLAIVLWGYFAAPTSEHRLGLPYRSLFALTMFGLSFYLLSLSGHVRLAFLFSIAALVTVGMATFWKQ